MANFMVMLTIVYNSDDIKSNIPLIMFTFCKSGGGGGYLFSF